MDHTKNVNNESKELKKQIGKGELEVDEFTT